MAINDELWSLRDRRKLPDCLEVLKSITASLTIAVEDPVRHGYLVECGSIARELRSVARALEEIRKVGDQ